ncbi:MAG: putative galactoside O-acetyltransferase [Verrucomicrobiales bacterium]|nr:putative galactoside O-acetyltransferase [Verrucomicrobiales bacterium]
MNYTLEELKNLGFVDVGTDVAIHRSAVFFNCKNIHIGSRVRIDCFSMISAGKEGVYIGNNIHIAAAVLIFGGGGRVTLEDFTCLSGRVSLYTASDDYSGEAMTNPTVPEIFRKVDVGPVSLRKHALVGAGSIIMPGVTIGTGAAVGAMSFANRDVPDHEIYAGIPARRIRIRQKKLLDLEKEYLQKAIT